VRVLGPVDPPDERLAPIEASPPVDVEAPAQGESVAADPFAFAAAPAPPVATPAAAVAAPVAVAPAAVAPPAPASPALEVPLPNPPPLPALGDAFAALLAAEQGGPGAPDQLWPASPAGTAHAVGDEVIEEIVRRVLDRLSDTVVRDAVADATSQVAERLVREEIARIKASIR